MYSTIIFNFFLFFREIFSDKKLSKYGHNCENEPGHKRGPEHSELQSKSHSQYHHVQRKIYSRPYGGIT